MSAPSLVPPPPPSATRRRALLCAGAGLCSAALGGLTAAAQAQAQARSREAAAATAAPGAVAPVAAGQSLPVDRRLTATAQLMAGITPASGDPVIDRLATLDAFVEHQAWMLEQWPPVRARLDTMEAWRDQHIRVPDAPARTLLYPFSGPDFLNAYALFPNHARYVFFGLERPSALPDLSRLQPQAFALLLASVRDALRDIFERNYFITSYMTRQLGTPKLRGTVPVMAVMMALNNRQIVSAEPFDLFPELTAAYSERNTDPSVRRPRMPLRGFRIVFQDPATRGNQTLHYFSLDATDRALAFYPGFTAWLSRQGPATALIKSASYLLHDRQFLQVREALLATADTIVQDDTGVPFRVLREGGWNVQLFGEYRKPIPSLAYGFQRDLQDSYQKLAQPAPLPFPFGYHWREGGAGSGLQIATRKIATANAPANAIR